MNFAEHLKYTKELENRISILEFLLRDAGMIKIGVEGVRVPRVTSWHVLDGKMCPVYQMDSNGMVEYF